MKTSPNVGVLLEDTLAFFNPRVLPDLVLMSQGVAQCSLGTGWVYLFPYLETPSKHVLLGGEI